MVLMKIFCWCSSDAQLGGNCTAVSLGPCLSTDQQWKKVGKMDQFLKEIFGLFVLFYLDPPACDETKGVFALNVAIPLNSLATLTARFESKTLRWNFPPDSNGTDFKAFGAASDVMWCFPYFIYMRTRLRVVRLLIRHVQPCILTVINPIVNCFML